MSDLLDCQSLAKSLGRCPHYVTAMKRAGYVFHYKPLGKTTLEHALAWLSCRPNFNHIAYLSKKWRSLGPCLPPAPEPAPTATKGRSRAIPRPVRRAVLEREGGKCHYCGDESDLTFDHKEPFAKGGEHDAENIVVACFSCNLTKRTMGYEEFKKVAHLRPKIGGGRPWGGTGDGRPTPEQEARLLCRLYGLNYETIIAILKENEAKKQRA